MIDSSAQTWGPPTWRTRREEVSGMSTMRLAAVRLLRDTHTDHRHTSHLGGVPSQTHLQTLIRSFFGCYFLRLHCRFISRVRCLNPEFLYFRMIFIYSEQSDGVYPDLQPDYAVQFCCKQNQCLKSERDLCYDSYPKFTGSRRNRTAPDSRDSTESAAGTRRSLCRPGSDHRSGSVGFFFGSFRIILEKKLCVS